MGRQLYSEWSEYWPQQGSDVPFSEFINTIPKYVVSSSLDSPEWTNTTVLRNADDVRRAKEEAPKDVGISGSATTVRWLLSEGLLDELQLLVHPIAVGHGRRLFEDTATFPLSLTHHEVLDTGVLHLTYAPAA
jgi:dihydrofolate reductase